MRHDTIHDPFKGTKSTSLTSGIAWYENQFSWKVFIIVWNKTFFLVLLALLWPDCMRQLKKCGGRDKKYDFFSHGKGLFVL